MFLYKNWNRYSKDRQNACKNAWALISLLMICFSMAVIRDYIMTPTTFLDPRSTKVFAKEPTPTPARTWDENAKLIVDTFKDMGEEEVMTALRVFKCESGWREKAVNNNEPDGSNSRGIAMINSIHGLPDSLRLDAKKALEWAKAKVKRDGGWYAWSCY